MIENYMIWIWVAVFVLALVLEACTQDIVSIWFSLGALVCICISNTGIPYWGEIIIFSIISMVTLILTRPLVKKMLDRNIRSTNTDEFIGKKVCVCKKISKYDPGEVKINDVIYTAILAEDDNSAIELNSIVEILTLKGNKVVVKQIENSEDK